MKTRKNPASGEDSTPPKSPERAIDPSGQPSWQGQERRRESRVKEEDKVIIEILSDGQLSTDKTVISALTRDISPGGARLTSNMALPVNTLLRMEIVLSERRRVVHVMGTVRWWARSTLEVELFEIGIEFTQISPDDKTLLLEHTYKKRG